MSELIIHHAGVYNIYSSVSDGPYFESGLTLEQLKHWIKEEYGRQGLENFDVRVERAHLKGSSGVSSRTLVDTIGANVEGLTEDQFIQKYLTIRSADNVAVQE